MASIVVVLFDYFSIRLWSFSFSSFVATDQPPKQCKQPTRNRKRQFPKLRELTVCHNRSLSQKVPQKAHTCNKNQQNNSNPCPANLHLTDSPPQIHSLSFKQLNSPINVVYFDSAITFPQRRQVGWIKLYPHTHGRTLSHTMKRATDRGHGDGTTGERGDTHMKLYPTRAQSVYELQEPKQNIQ